MNIAQADERRMLQESTQRFLAQRHPVALARRALPWSDDAQRALWQDMADMGWLGLLADERQGGTGLGMGEAFLVAEAAGRQLVNLPLVSSMVLLPLLQRLAARPVPRLDDWLQELLAGRAAFNVTFAGAPYLHRHRQCSHQLLLRGLCSDAGPALALLPEEPAGAPEEGASSGLDPTLRSVARPAQGPQGPAEGALQWEALAIAPPDQAWVLACYRLACVAELLGAASAALDAACEHARTRVQFGRPIGSNQAIKHALANGWMALDNARLAGQYAAAALDARQQDWRFACAAAEYTTIAGGLEVGHGAIQVHGGLGFSWEHDAHLYLKRMQHIAALLGGADAALATIQRMDLDAHDPAGRVAAARAQAPGYVA